MSRRQNSSAKLRRLSSNGLDPSYISPSTSTFIPTKFVPPSPLDTPSSLFISGESQGVHYRFVRRGSPKEMLIFTDGSCLNNGRDNPSAGWAFVFRSATLTPKMNYGTLSGRLESRGPTGDPSLQTSNRAELRAVIAALQFRVWHGEGWKRIVIATDSEYVVEGSCVWAHRWEQNGWLTTNRTPVANQDLWKVLLSLIRKAQTVGLEVVFWRIPRQLNQEADLAAKQAAAESEVVEFRKLNGGLDGQGGMMVFYTPSD